MDILKLVKTEVSKVDLPDNRSNYQQFFKEKLKNPIGLRVPTLRKASNKCYDKIKNLSKKEIIDFCDILLESDFRYKRFFAFEWAIKQIKRFEKSDFARFERWLKKYVDNWGSCDHLSGAFGSLILKYPELFNKVFKWTKSKNRWLKRASAVSLIDSAKKGLLLEEVFKTADTLLMDDDDMVQKGYGWMLKDASLYFPDEVFAYVLKHKDKMPRTALRYAIERYSKEKRKEAMSR